VSASCIIMSEGKKYVISLVATICLDAEQGQGGYD